MARNKRSEKALDILSVRRPRPRYPERTASTYPMPPRELAGKWVAWSKDRQLLFAGETLAEIMDRVERDSIKGASYERLPKLRRSHSH